MSNYLNRLVMSLDKPLRVYAILVIWLTPLISNCQINTQLSLRERQKASKVKASRSSHSSTSRGVPIPPPTPLMLAAKKGDVAKVQKLLNEGTDVKEINGSRALVLAVQANHLEIAQKLLEHGADPNVSVRITYFNNTEGKPNTQRRVDGILLLRQAIRDNKVRTVNLLLNAGANPNLQDSNTDSMFQEALLNNTYISFLHAYNETV